MKKNELEIIIALIALAMEKGPAIITSLIAVLDKDDITLEDIEGLRITKNPDEF